MSHRALLALGLSKDQGLLFAPYFIMISERMKYIFSKDTMDEHIVTLTTLNAI